MYKQTSSVLYKQHDLIMAQVINFVEGFISSLLIQFAKLKLHKISVLNDPCVAHLYGFLGAVFVCGVLLLHLSQICLQ